MMLYDLTKTAVATSDQAIRPPNEPELLAITVALLSCDDRSFSELASSTLELSQRNCRRVAELIEERTPSLTRDFGDPVLLRARLRQLIGLQIFREFQ